MGDSITEILHTDEQVLWQGTPEAFSLLDKTNKKSILIRVIVTAAVCIAAVIAYYSSMRSTSEFKIGIPIGILLLGVLVMATPLMDARRIRRQTFVITSERLLWKSESIREIPFSAIKEYLFSMDEDGHTTLLVGRDAVRKKSRKWRTMGAGTVFTDDEGICEQAVFYAIPEPEKFKKIFEEQMQ
ncbi:MAG: hypothetical protein IJI61_05945 [Oscillospiraceae bacterium]|nr:hypothetical protein [Oscillospiraceae bacterium]